VPSSEYMETVHKASAVQRAIDLAEAGLDPTAITPHSPAIAAFLDEQEREQAARQPLGEQEQRQQRTAVPL